MQRDCMEQWQKTIKDNQFQNTSSNQSTFLNILEFYQYCIKDHFCNTHYSKELWTYRYSVLFYRQVYFMKNFTILSDLHITILRPIIMQLSSMIVHIFFASFLILELEVPILWEQLTDTHRRPIMVCTLQNMKVMLNEMT